MSNFPGVHFTGKGLQPIAVASPLDVSYAALLAVEVLRWVSAEIDDEPVLRASLEAAYTPLLALPNAYRLYPVLPNVVSFEALLAAADGKRPEGIDPVWRWNPLWTPGSKKNSYTAAELDGTEKEPSVRVALRNPEDTDYDPLLHFLSLPYDKKYRKDGQQTQLEALKAYKTAFESDNEGFNLDTITDRDFLIMMLMDRIEGKASQNMTLSRGWMHCPELDRRSVDGGSVVGDVCSRDGQLRLDRSFGYAVHYEGLGLSAGKTVG